MVDDHVPVVSWFGVVDQQKTLIIVCWNIIYSFIYGFIVFLLVRFLSFFSVVIGIFNMIIIVFSSLRFFIQESDGRCRSI